MRNWPQVNFLTKYFSSYFPSSPYPPSFPSCRGQIWTVSNVSFSLTLSFLTSGAMCGQKADASPLLPSSSFSDYQEEKNGRLQWKVCVNAFPTVTTRPWPPERLRSTTTRGICTSWRGLFPSFNAWVRFNTWEKTVHYSCAKATRSL